MRRCSLFPRSSFLFGLLSLTGLNFVGLSVALPVQAQTIPDERNFPAQYLSKIYTEALGRGPDQVVWRNLIDYYGTLGCNNASLRGLGELILQTQEFNDLGYDNAAKLLVAHRAILNREPEATQYNAWLTALNQQTTTFPAIVASFYSSAEFQTLTKQICNTKQTSYSFGSNPAIDIPINGAGFVGDENALQAALNAAPPGTTISLAPRLVIRLSKSLVIPPGVVVTTTGGPLPNRYAEMTRLVRVGDWVGPMVDLQFGAKLYSVWIDGQRGNLPNRYQPTSINVRMLSGTQTTIAHSRVGNSRGATTIELFGNITGQRCQQNWVYGNLIEAYSSNHLNNEWTDGVSNACENANIANNTVIDATDVPIISFAVIPRENQIPQSSQVYNNTIIQAGNSAYAAIAMDAALNSSGPGDPPNVASRSFEGGAFRDNLMWTSDRTHFDIAIAVGTKPWFGDNSYNGIGGAFTGNATGQLRMSIGTGIIVSGMLQTTVLDNRLQLRPVKIEDPKLPSTNTFFGKIAQIFNRNPRKPCATTNVGAAVSAGFASGNIQQPYSDRIFSSCIISGR
jgi:hypothetical protein